MDVSFGMRLEEALAGGLGQIAVPGFFCMSGFLFFRNLSVDIPSPCSRPAHWPGIGFFLGKWKKRVFSLLIPYLVWNFLYYLIYLAFGRASLEAVDFLKGLFLQEYNPVFWYLRELLILTLLTPFIFWLIRNKVGALISLNMIFLLSVFYDRLPFHIVNEDACFYYVFGSYAALWFGKSIMEDEPLIFSWNKIRILSALICVITLFLIIFCGRFFIPDTAYRVAIGAEILFRTSGVALIFSLVSLTFSENRTMFFLRRGPSKSPCAGAREKTANIKLLAFIRCNFLIYALHYLEIRFFWIIFSFLGIGPYATDLSGVAANDTVDFFIFLGMPALCVLLTYAINIILLRFFPKLLDIITGGRS